LELGANEAVSLEPVSFLLRSTRVLFQIFFVLFCFVSFSFAPLFILVSDMSTEVSKHRTPCASCEKLAVINAETRAENNLAAAIRASCTYIPDDPRLLTFLYPELTIDRVPNEPVADFVWLACRFLATVKPFCDSADVVTSLSKPDESTESACRYAENLANVCAQVLPCHEFRRATDWPSRDKALVRTLADATTEMLVDACECLKPRAWLNYIGTLRFTVDDLD